MVLSASSSVDASIWWVLVLLVAISLLLIQLRRRQFRTTTARDLTREQLARLRDQRDVRQSMDQLLIQLEELSRRINAQVDTKFLKLETVIRDADDRLARLERVLGRGKGPAPSTASPQDAGAPKPAPPEALADPAPAPVDPRSGRVYELADRGKRPIDIAEELDLTLGEVELILNLRGFR